MMCSETILFHSFRVTSTVPYVAEKYRSEETAECAWVVYYYARSETNTFYRNTLDTFYRLFRPIFNGNGRYGRTTELIQLTQNEWSKRSSANVILCATCGCANLDIYIKAPFWALNILDWSKIGMKLYLTSPNHSKMWTLSFG